MQRSRFGLDAQVDSDLEYFDKGDRFDWSEVTLKITWEAEFVLGLLCWSQFSWSEMMTWV